jgi:hypothetical protein
MMQSGKRLRKKTILTCVRLALMAVGFFAFPFLGWSQSAPGKLELSSPYKMPGKSEEMQVVGLTGNEIILFRKRNVTAFTTKTKIHLERYDRSDMDLKNAQEIVLRSGRQNLNFEKLLYLKGDLWLFSSFNNQAQEKNFLFKQKVSARSLTPSNRIEKMLEGPAYRDDPTERTFDFVLSKDSSKVLIYNQFPTKRNTPEQFALQIFDSSLEPIWSKNVVLPYPDNQFSIEEYQVDKEGNVYLLGILYVEGDDRRLRRDLNYRYVILAYRNQGEEFIELDVDLRDKFITDLTFRVDNKGQLVCSGFYSERSVYGIKGSYFLRINPDTRELFFQNTKPFDFDFLTSDLSNRRRERARRAEAEGDLSRSAELSNYQLTDLILRTDGGALLVAEQFYVDRQSYFTWDGRIQDVFYYHYNDIIVVNIRPNGEVEWATRIPKEQVTTNDGGYYSSFSMATVRDRLFFVYNGHGSNSGRGGGGSGSVLMLAEVRIDGSLSVYPLALRSDIGMPPRPKVFRQIGSREMMIYAEWGRNYRMGKLKFLL